MHDESTGRSAFLKAGYPYKLKTPWLLYGALNSSRYFGPRLQNPEVHYRVYNGVYGLVTFLCRMCTCWLFLNVGFVPPQSVIAND